MENVVVVFKSRTGFTDGYAHWIAEELGCEIYPLENVNLVNFSPFDMVIFGGGVRAGKIDGIHFIKKALKSCPEKQLVVFATGAAPQEDTEAAKRVQQGNIPANVEIPFFYFQSGINYERMKGVDKLIMSVVRMIMRGMKEKDMAQIAAWVGQIAAKPADEKLQRRIRDEVIAFTEKFPVP